MTTSDTVLAPLSTPTRIEQAIQRPVVGHVLSDDGRLLHRARAGDQSAFAELYERHVDRVYRYCLLRLGNSHDAEDVTEQAFVRAFRSIAQQRDAEFAPWLFRIARTLLVDRHRAEKRFQQTAHLFITHAGHSDPEPEIDRLVDGDLLRRAVRQLTPDQQHVILLRFGEGMSLSTVASTLGKRVSAVEKLQERGLAALRRCIGSRPLSK